MPGSPQRALTVAMVATAVVWPAAAAPCSWLVMACTGRVWAAALPQEAKGAATEAAAAAAALKAACRLAPTASLGEGCFDLDWGAP